MSSGDYGSVKSTDYSYTAISGVSGAVAGYHASGGSLVGAGVGASWGTVMGLFADVHTEGLPSHAKSLEKAASILE